MKILITYDPPPIPHRTMDWQCYDVDNYEASYEDGAWRSHGIIGYGRTWEEALEDFEEQHLEELDEGEDLPDELIEAMNVAALQQERFDDEELADKKMDPQTGVLSE